MYQQITALQGELFVDIVVGPMEERYGTQQSVYQDNKILVTLLDGTEIEVIIE